MPINNEILGVYKTVKVDGKYVIVETADRDQTMEVTPKPFVQGTPKTRILDIGGVKEDIAINAPILVGGGSRIDGRALFNERLGQILTNPAGATLPLLTSANISVDQKQARINMRLLSDGDPTVTQVFQVSSDTAEDLTDGVYTDLLNPVHSNSAIKPTRTATFYDFRVSICGHTFYIMNCNLDVKIEAVSNFFLGAKVPATDTDPQGNVTVGALTYKSGTQFPMIGVGSIGITGSGKGAVALTDLNSDGDFNDYTGNQDAAGDESINLALGTNTADVTLQEPGQVIYDASGFALQFYNGTNWVDLIPDVDLTRSVIHGAKFAVSTGLMTVDFSFTCWVK